MLFKVQNHRPLVPMSNLSLQSECIFTFTLELNECQFKHLKNRIKILNSFVKRASVFIFEETEEKSVVEIRQSLLSQFFLSLLN